jgi:FimV-like protein
LIYGESKMLLSLILLVTILYFLRRVSYFKTITNAKVNGRSSNSKDLSKQESLENEFTEIDALEIKMSLIRSLIDDNEDDAAKEVLKELISESVGKDKETAQAMLKDLEKS